MRTLGYHTPPEGGVSSMHDAILLCGVFPREPRGLERARVTAGPQL